MSKEVGFLQFPGSHNFLGVHFYFYGIPRNLVSQIPRNSGENTTRNYDRDTGLTLEINQDKLQYCVAAAVIAIL